MDNTSHRPEFLFHQTAAQVRRTGARGGRATARNRRARQRAAAAPAQSTRAPVEPREETAAEAIARLDAQFPWLRGVHRPPSRSAASPPAR